MRRVKYAVPSLTEDRGEPLIVLGLFNKYTMLLFVFVCKKVAKLISIWLKKMWTFSHIG